MSFYYQKYGTFTGIGTYQYTYRDNDDFTNNFYDDGVFNLNDISMVLLNTPQDFVTLHLDGHNTDQLTLEKVQGSFISTVASPGFDYDTYGHYYTYGTSLPIETIKFNVNNFNVGYAGGGDGNTNVKGDFKVNTDKFTVSAPTGNTDVKGDFKVNTDKFTVSAPTGNTDVKGDLKVNTNKFTVSASTGDTYIDRDLDVDRNLTAAHFYGNGSGLSGIISGSLGSDGLILYNDNGSSNGTSQLYYDDINHRVGIGTTNPNQKLHVNGNVVITGITTVGLTPTTNPTLNSSFSFELTSNTTLTIRVKGTDGTVRTGTVTLSWQDPPCRVMIPE